MGDNFQIDYYEMDIYLTLKFHSLYRYTIVSRNYFAILCILDGILYIFDNSFIRYLTFILLLRDSAIGMGDLYIVS